MSMRRIWIALCLCLVVLGGCGGERAQRGASDSAAGEVKSTQAAAPIGESPAISVASSPIQQKQSFTVPPEDITHKGYSLPWLNRSSSWISAVGDGRLVIAGAVGGSIVDIYLLDSANENFFSGAAENFSNLLSRPELWAYNHHRTRLNSFGICRGEGSFTKDRYDFYFYTHQDPDNQLMRRRFSVDVGRDSDGQLMLLNPQISESSAVMVAGGQALSGRHPTLTADGRLMVFTRDDGELVYSINETSCGDEGWSDAKLLWEMNTDPDARRYPLAGQPMRNFVGGSIAFYQSPIKGDQPWIDPAGRNVLFNNGKHTVMLGADTSWMGRVIDGVGFVHAGSPMSHIAGFGPFAELLDAHGAQDLLGLSYQHPHPLPLRRSWGRLGLVSTDGYYREIDVWREEDQPLMSFDMTPNFFGSVIDHTQRRTQSWRPLKWGRLNSIHGPEYLVDWEPVGSGFGLNSVLNTRRGGHGYPVEEGEVPFTELRSLTLELSLKPTGERNFQNCGAPVRRTILETTGGGAPFSLYSLGSEQQILLNVYKDGLIGGPNTPLYKVNGIESDTWNHVAFTWDGSNGETRIFINGRRVYTQVKSGLAGKLLPWESLTLGGSSEEKALCNDKAPFIGYLDNFKLTGRVKSDQEICLSTPGALCDMDTRRTVELPRRPFSLSDSRFRTSVWSRVSVEHQQAVQCQGALINGNMVVTAASCVVGIPPQELHVAINEERIPVSGVAIHPLYNRTADDANLAVLRLTNSQIQATVIPLATLADLGALGAWSSFTAEGYWDPKALMTGQVVTKNTAVDEVNPSREVRIERALSFHRSSCPAGRDRSNVLCSAPIDGPGGVNALKCSDTGAPIYSRIHGRWKQVGLVGTPPGCGSNPSQERSQDVSLAGYQDWFAGLLPKNDDLIIDMADTTQGWSAYTGMSVVQDTEDYKSGRSSLRSSGSGTGRFVKRFAKSVDARGYKYLKFWYYIDRPELIRTGNGQIEITSSGSYDVEEKRWSISSLGLKAGWNPVVLEVDLTRTNNGIDLSQVDYFRLYHAVNGQVTTRIDDLRFSNNPEMPETALWVATERLDSTLALPPGQSFYSPTPLTGSSSSTWVKAALLKGNGEMREAENQEAMTFDQRQQRLTVYRLGEDETPVLEDLIGATWREPSAIFAGAFDGRVSATDEVGFLFASPRRREMAVLRPVLTGEQPTMLTLASLPMEATHAVGLRTEGSVLGYNLGVSNIAVYDSLSGRLRVYNNFPQNSSPVIDQNIGAGWDWLLPAAVHIRSGESDLLLVDAETNRVIGLRVDQNPSTSEHVTFYIADIQGLLPTQPSDVLVGDINRDGYSDLVAVEGFGQSYRKIFYFYNPDKSTWERTETEKSNALTKAGETWHSGVILPRAGELELVQRVSQTLLTSTGTGTDASISGLGNCGDGWRSTVEACDDGNQVNGDGCSAQCGLETAQSESCGNGIVEFGESCDDGNNNSFDGCSASCQQQVGFNCIGETCRASCGNFILDIGESCDDGNRQSGDGCSSFCGVEQGYGCGLHGCTVAGRSPSCGDGVVQWPESCDTGGIQIENGCNSQCELAEGFSCYGPGQACFSGCGNGIKEAGEACDDGNALAGDGCSASCAIEIGGSCVGTQCGGTAVCGDGAITRGIEQCDDGNSLSGDGCSAQCRTEIVLTPERPPEGETFALSFSAQDQLSVDDIWSLSGPLSPGELGASELTELELINQARPSSLYEGGDMLGYGLRYNGVPVYERGLVIHTDSERNIRFVVGRVLPEFTANTAAAGLTEDQALALVSAAFGTELLPEHEYSISDLWVVSSESTLSDWRLNPAWSIRLGGGERGIVDLATGRLVTMHHEMVFNLFPHSEAYRQVRSQGSLPSSGYRTCTVTIPPEGNPTGALNVQEFTGSGVTLAGVDWCTTVGPLVESDGSSADSLAKVVVTPKYLGTEADGADIYRIPRPYRNLNEYIAGLETSALPNPILRAEAFSNPGTTRFGENADSPEFQFSAYTLWAVQQSAQYFKQHIFNDNGQPWLGLEGNGRKSLLINLFPYTLFDNVRHRSAVAAAAQVPSINTLIFPESRYKHHMDDLYKLGLDLGIPAGNVGGFLTLSADLLAASHTAAFYPHPRLSVITHEYSHLVSYFRHPLTSDPAGIGMESGAIEEGLADILGHRIATEINLNNGLRIPAYCQFELMTGICDTRNFGNPHATGNPAFYEEEQFWCKEGNCLHQNSTILSHWYYLLSKGSNGRGQDGCQYGFDPLAGNEKDAQQRVVDYLMVGLAALPREKWSYDYLAQVIMDRNLGLIQTARAAGASSAVLNNLVDERHKLIAAWRAVGINVQDEIKLSYSNSVMPTTITLDVSSPFYFPEGLPPVLEVSNRVELSAERERYIGIFERFRESSSVDFNLRPNTNYVARMSSNRYLSVSCAKPHPFVTGKIAIQLLNPANDEGIYEFKKDKVLIEWQGPKAGVNNYQISVGREASCGTAGADFYSSSVPVTGATGVMKHEVTLGVVVDQWVNLQIFSDVGDPIDCSSFKVQRNMLEKPDLISPLPEDAPPPDEEVNFKWSPVKHADRYRVQVWHRLEGQGRALVINETEDHVPNANILELAAGVGDRYAPNGYCWAVRAEVEGGPTKESDQECFQLGASEPKLISPTGNNGTHNLIVDPQKSTDLLFTYETPNEDHLFYVDCIGPFANTRVFDFANEFHLSLTDGLSLPGDDIRVAGPISFPQSQPTRFEWRFREPHKLNAINALRVRDGQQDDHGREWNWYNVLRDGTRAINGEYRKQCVWGIEYMRTVPGEETARKAHAALNLSARLANPIELISPLSGVYNNPTGRFFWKTHPTVGGRDPENFRLELWERGREGSNLISARISSSHNGDNFSPDRGDFLYVANSTTLEVGKSYCWRVRSDEAGVTMSSSTECFTSVIGPPRLWEDPGQFIGICGINSRGQVQSTSSLTIGYFPPFEAPPGGHSVYLYCASPGNFKLANLMVSSNAILTTGSFEEVIERVTFPPAPLIDVNGVGYGLGDFVGGQCQVGVVSNRRDSRGQFLYHEEGRPFPVKDCRECLGENNCPEEPPSCSEQCAQKEPWVFFLTDMGDTTVDRSAHGRFAHRLIDSLQAKTGAPVRSGAASFCVQDNGNPPTLEYFNPYNNGTAEHLFQPTSLSGGRILRDGDTGANIVASYGQRATCGAGVPNIGIAKRGYSGANGYADLIRNEMSRNSNLQPLFITLWNPPGKNVGADFLDYMDSPDANNYIRQQGIKQLDIYVGTSRSGNPGAISDGDKLFLSTGSLSSDSQITDRIADMLLDCGCDD